MSGSKAKAFRFDKAACGYNERKYKIHGTLVRQLAGLDQCIMYSTVAFDKNIENRDLRLSAFALVTENITHFTIT